MNRILFSKLDFHFAAGCRQAIWCYPFSQTTPITFYNGRNLSTGNKADVQRNIRKMLTHLPFFLGGEIVQGFGRGSKELGIPTANYSLEVVRSLPNEFPTGVYYGWANVNNGDVHKMVLSIGWNPFYKNTEKSIETHILNDYQSDLYGKFLKICIVGYLRQERNFDSLNELISAIRGDIDDAKKLLDTTENIKLKAHQYFQDQKFSQ